MKTPLTLVILITSFFIVTAQHTNKDPYISVTGEGIVNVVPDNVTVKVRIEEEGKSAVEVKSNVDNAVDNVLQFLKKLNIDEKNYQTNYVRLDKNYDYNKKVYTYKANQSIIIKLENLDQYEPLMSGLVQKGVNRIDGIQFGSSKAEQLEIEARQKAVKDAKIKAEQFASVLNQTVGKATAINEVNTNSGGPQYKMMAMDAMESSSISRQTLAKGEMQIAVKVNITFSLN